MLIIIKNMYINYHDILRSFDLSSESHQWYIQILHNPSLVLIYFIWFIRFRDSLNILSSFCLLLHNFFIPKYRLGRVFTFYYFLLRLLNFYILASNHLLWKLWLKYYCIKIVYIWNHQFSHLEFDFILNNCSFSKL